MTLETPLSHGTCTTRHSTLDIPLRLPCLIVEDPDGRDLT